MALRLRTHVCDISVSTRRQRFIDQTRTVRNTDFVRQSNEIQSQTKDFVAQNKKILSQNNDGSPHGFRDLKKKSEVKELIQSRDSASSLRQKRVQRFVCM